MITYLLTMAAIGLVVGALARLSLPGKDPMSIFQTILLGIAGALIGAVIAYAIADTSYTTGLPLCVGVSSIILYVVRKRRGGGLTDPGVRKRK